MVQKPLCCVEFKIFIFIFYYYFFFLPTCITLPQYGTEQLLYIVDKVVVENVFYPLKWYELV